MYNDRLRKTVRLRKGGNRRALREVQALFAELRYGRFIGPDWYQDEPSLLVHAAGYDMVEWHMEPSYLRAFPSAGFQRHDMSGCREDVTVMWLPRVAAETYEDFYSDEGMQLDVYELATFNLSALPAGAPLGFCEYMAHGMKEGDLGYRLDPDQVLWLSSVAGTAAPHGVRLADALTLVEIDAPIDHEVLDVLLGTP